MPLSKEIIKSIKKDYESGMGYKELAKKYRMSFRDLSKVLRGEVVAVVQQG